MGRQLAILTVICGAASLANADVYSWVDKEGVIHFTNIPPGGTLAQEPGSENTFSWKDDVGALRRVHRVQVTKYDALIDEAARYYSLPAALVKAVIAAESAFEPRAVSPAGAQGLMQLMPPTAAAVFVKDAFDPKENIFGGTRYLRELSNRLGGDVRMAIAAYNAGPDVVARSGGVPRIPETETYVKRVLKLYQHYLRNGL